MSEYIYATDGDTVQNMLSEVFKPLQEIVRCRDCKWFMPERKSKTRGCFEILHPAFCNKHITNTEPDGFCAWGERE